MRKLVAVELVSLDGVMESPEEWAFGYADDEMNEAALVRSLLKANLLDELRLMLHPVVLGSGKRLFEGWGDTAGLTLVDSKTFGTGVVSLAYQPERS